MYAGAFNEKIEIWKFTKTKNEYGELITVSEKIRDTRAKVSHLSGSRTIQASEIVYPYNKVFYLRYYEDINEDMMIKWQSHLYRVLSIDKNRELQCITVTCEVVNE